VKPPLTDYAERLLSKTEAKAQAKAQWKARKAARKSDPPAACAQRRKNRIDPPV